MHDSPPRLADDTRFASFQNPCQPGEEASTAALRATPTPVALYWRPPVLLLPSPRWSCCVDIEAVERSSFGTFSLATSSGK